MKIQYDFVEFHSPVFIKGKNHGTKIYSKDGIELWFDTDLRFMCMEYKGTITDFDTWHTATRKSMPTVVETATAIRRGRPARQDLGQQ